MAGDVARVGVIGGSGVYELDTLTNARWQAVETPWGAPSDEVLLGELSGLPMAFLPRHGRGHPLPPSGIDYRANIDALKRVGCRAVISISAVGSLRHGLDPGMFVLVDQFIDRTHARAKSFFGPGLAAHVSMARPVCAGLCGCLEGAAAAAGARVVRGGTYLAMEGPQFSTLAESNLYRSWGCDVIGMTNMPEAKLAREAELCYATVAMVTDYDCWHPHRDDVTVEAILGVLTANAARARRLIECAAPLLRAEAPPCPHGCDRALDHAIITAPDKRDPALVAKLDAVAGRVLNPLPAGERGAE